MLLMKVRLFTSMAVLVVGLLACASSASAALTYFDAQIVDFTVSSKSGDVTTPKNTVMCNPGQNCAETPFTVLPIGPGTEGPPATTDPNGNWTLDNANSPTNTGTDNLWNRRVNNAFGNPDASGSGTIYEALGLNGGPNTEDAPVLKTTVNVPQADQGTLQGVYALFWTDQSTSWKLSACLTCVEDENMPVFVGNDNSGYVFGVYDVGAGDPGNLSLFDLEMNGYTTSDGMPTGSGGTNRRLKAAWLGNVTLGQVLTAYVGDGPAPADPTNANSRVWYDGIAYGDVQDLAQLPCVPEPSSLVLLGLGVAGFALRRRG
jgi:hypothetical protein